MNLKSALLFINIFFFSAPCSSLHLPQNIFSEVSAEIRIHPYFAAASVAVASLPLMIDVAYQTLFIPRTPPHSILENCQIQALSQHLDARPLEFMRCLAEQNDPRLFIKAVEENYLSLGTALALARVYDRFDALSALGFFYKLSFSEKRFSLFSRIIAESSFPLITLDGGSATGKGTLGKRLSDFFGCTNLEVGLFYRLLAHLMEQDNCESTNVHCALPLLPHVFEQYPTIKNNQTLYEILRAENTALRASQIAPFPEVRAHINNHQQNLIENATSCVLIDGRSTAFVFPNAPFKIFLDAQADIKFERALDRCHNEGGSNCEVEAGKVRQRSINDQTRENHPAIPAEDAYYLDNSFLSKNQTLLAALLFMAENDNNKKLYQANQ